MLRHSLVVALVCSTSFTAFADSPATPAEITGRLEAIASRSSGQKPDAPKFAFTSVLANDGASVDDAVFGLPEIAISDKAKTTVGTNGSDVAWISANLGEFAYCAKPGCPKQTPETWLRATVLFEKTGAIWQPLAWSLTPPIPGSDQVQAIADNVMPIAIKRDTTGADDVAKAFETAIADPKLLAAAFSAKKEVVLYGSELPERFVAAAAGKQIATWGLAFKLRDGLRAGMSKSGNTAWVAANVDGKFVKNAKMKPVPYRVFAIYEKTGTEWKIVAMQFSTQV